MSAAATSSPRPVVNFDLNVPKIVTLEFPTPREVVGTYGTRCMFTCAEGVMFLDPAVATQLAQLEPAKGDQIRITRYQTQQGQRKAIAWKFERADAVLAIPAPPAPKPAAPAQHPGMPNPAFVENLDASLTASLMAVCLKQAVDALIVARRHAEAQGWTLEFFGEDVRAMANALFIQRTKGGAPCSK